MKCAFTNQDIDSIDPLDLAVIYHNNNTKKESNRKEEEGQQQRSSSCTRTSMCSLKSLITYLCSTSTKDYNHYPISFEKKSIESIYDGVSNKILNENMGRDDDNNDNTDDKDSYDIIFFKWNKQTFHLAILKKKEERKKGYFYSLEAFFHYLSNKIKTTRTNQSSSSSSSSSDSNISSTTFAQERIGAVLGMDYKQNIKILYKGKVIYPNQTKDNKSSSISISISPSPLQISQKLIEISTSDHIEKRRNPSLVVMGTRRDDIIIENNHSDKSVLFEMKMKLKQLLYSRYSRYILFIGTSGMIFLLRRLIHNEQLTMMTTTTASVDEL